MLVGGLTVAGMGLLILRSGGRVPPLIGVLHGGAETAGWLLDEPLVNLDYKLREELRGLRERVRESSEASLERLRELRLGSQEVEDDGAGQRRGEGPQGG